MLHPTLINSQSAWSRHKTHRLHNTCPEICPTSAVSRPYAIPEESPLEIITLNLAFFPFSPGSAQMLYDFIANNPVHVFIFQEVKDTKLLSSVFEYVNSELYSQNYVLYFSSHIHNRTKLCFAFRNNSIEIILRKSMFVNIFKKTPHIIRPPDILVFKYQDSLFSLVNLHSTPYTAHSSQLKREKFFYLLNYYQQTFKNDRFIIFGGDWNFRPPGLEKFFNRNCFKYPGLAFKNIIDYFVTSYPSGTLYTLFDTTLFSFAKTLNDSKHFKDWKKILSDHFPVRYSFEFIK